MFIKGTLFGFALLLVIAAFIIGSIIRARRGFLPRLRIIPGVEAIPEAIGRAAEVGRPVLFNPGIADLSGDYAAQTYAGLEILAHVSRLCAKYDVSIIVPIRQASVLPVAEEIVKLGYLSEGKLDKLRPDAVRYISPFQFGYVSGVLGITERERIAANLILGATWSETPAYIEAGYGAGAIQIGGTANLHQIQFYVAGCDYTLIGEELFAGGAYVSQDRAKLGSIVGQDLGKILAVALVFLGVILATFKSNWLVNLMNK
ncbi:MAG: hypothetical protein M1553_01240 [Firmicutes bacterium]|nr:hypothetical protein [Bacillota bacterium]